MFVVDLFEHILAFENQQEQQRLQLLARNETNDENDNDVDMERENSTIVRLNDDDEMSELDRETVANREHLYPISIVDILLKEYFAKYLMHTNSNIRYNSILVIKNVLKTHDEIDEDTFNVLRDVRYIY